MERVVFKRRRSEASRREREGLVSWVLLHGRDPEGSGQRPHSHAPEQVYVIVRGRRRRMVGGEERVVTEGDLIRIPPYTIHGIENPADEVLAYVSAATPAVEGESFYDTGPLRAR
jgi:mannose-6-phosphate isomerase-like protein (cupin superfamily)